MKETNAFVSSHSPTSLPPSALALGASTPQRILCEHLTDLAMRKDVPMISMKLSQRRLWNRPLNEHALRVMGEGSDGKMSWLIFLSKTLPNGFCVLLSAFSVSLAKRVVR
jgi:hypothetical protein